MKYQIGLAAIAMAIPASAAAQAPGQQEQLIKCAALESDAARLACFDAVMAGDKEVDEKVRKARKDEATENFGLSDGQAKSRRGDSKSVTNIVVRSAVTATRKEASGDLTFALANGQVWRTSGGGNLRYLLKRGDAITLEKGLLGGIQANVEGKKGFLAVKRIR